MNITNKQQFKPHSPSHYTQNNPAFNDYRLNSYSPKALNLQHHRASSTASIYFRSSNSNFSRKKLTVTSKDNQSHEFINDYNVTDRNNMQQEEHQNHLAYNQNYHNLNSYNNSVNSSQTGEHVSRLKLSKNKLRRNQSPMTPTKGLKLKKSFLNERSHHHLIKSQDKRQYHTDSLSTSQLKINKFGRKFYHYENNENSMQSMKQQILAKLQPIIKETEKRLSQQITIIKKLQSKLRHNEQRIRQKDNLIEQLRKVQKGHKSSNNASQSTQQNNFILTKIRDTQIKLGILLNQQVKLQKTQVQINFKLQIISTQFIKMFGQKMHLLRSDTQTFISEKTLEVSKLTQCINVLDNKLVGKTQALKQMIIQLKLKVKQIQDSGTKDTVTNKSHNHIQSAGGQNANHVSKNKHIRYFGNKIKQLTGKNPQNQNIAGSTNNKSSLNYSFISISQNYNTQEQRQFLQNFIQMQNQQTGSNKDQSKDETFISDCFFYPSTSQTISRNVSQTTSPINDKNDKYEGSVKFQAQQRAHINKIGKFLISNDSSKQMSCQSSDILPAFNFPQKQRYEVDSATINKKIQAIQSLIAQKKRKSGVNEPLRCFLDSSGYLKYVDSKTFVFDKKGNLIPLTGGQLYILVMKKLIQCTD